MHLVGHSTNKTVGCFFLSSLQVPRAFPGGEREGAKVLPEQTSSTGCARQKALDSTPLNGEGELGELDTPILGGLGENPEALRNHK